MGSWLLSGIMAFAALFILPIAETQSCTLKNLERDVPCGGLPTIEPLNHADVVNSRVQQTF
jgi:hypothetical protein